MRQTSGNPYHQGLSPNETKLLHSLIRRGFATATIVHKMGLNPKTVARHKEQLDRGEHYSRSQPNFLARQRENREHSNALHAITQHAATLPAAKARGLMLRVSKALQDGQPLDLTQLAG